MAKAEDRLLRASKQQRDGINKTGFTWKQFKSKLQVVSQVLGEQMLPYLQKLLEPLQKALDWFINLSPATKDWLIKLGVATAIIGPLLLVFGGLITFMVGLKVAASLLGVTVLGLFLPFMKFFLIWGLIGVAIYALKSIIENTFDTSLILPEWETVKEWFVEFFHFMGVGFSTLKEGIRDAFKNQGALLWDWLPQSWRDSIENSFRNLIGLERKGPVFGADYRPDSYFSYENTRQGSGVWEIDRGSTNLGSIDIKLSAEKGTSGKISETSINNKNLSINFIDEIYAGGTR